MLGALQPGRIGGCQEVLQSGEGRVCVGRGPERIGQSDHSISAHIGKAGEFGWSAGTTSASSSEHARSWLEERYCRSAGEHSQFSGGPREPSRRQDRLRGGFEARSRGQRQTTRGGVRKGSSRYISNGGRLSEGNANLRTDIERCARGG